MFDYIEYNGNKYQTKDTDSQWLADYKIEHDQTDGHEYLWEEKYECEWIEEKDSLLGGYLNKKNLHWQKCSDFTGNIIFYRNVDSTYEKWNQYNAIFVNGKMTFIYKWEGSDYE